MLDPDTAPPRVMAQAVVDRLSERRIGFYLEGSQSFTLHVMA
jgi:hypothetical protein